MALFQWPETILPLPQVNFNLAAEDANARTQMDGGEARQRSRFTISQETAQVTFELDAVSYAVFVGVWRDELNNGIDFFEMRMPVPDGDPLTLSEVRFISDYNAVSLSFEVYEITATIEFKPVIYLSADVLAVIISEGPDTTAFTAAAQSLEDEMKHFDTTPHPWIIL